MGFNEKADAMKDKVVGKVKEGAGKVTGDPDTEAEGKGQQVQGKVKEGIEKAKDTARDAGERAKGFTEGYKKD
ncbi:CsbD family protein [Enteractinococcus helveticum]|uniref:CsbD-like domain-containing protein n=1 Tax=Enteractinococcus helveticum TaxID=1837282 RepID=A0A1B7M230_9MICC|nr:CsbD family protein [Enteractinococcus helveticum]OAV62653.1 hypothetical protein A6F49_05705 [Enteractinococcus helveticum]